MTRSTTKIGSGRPLFQLPANRFDQITRQPLALIGAETKGATMDEFANWRRALAGEKHTHDVSSDGRVRTVKSGRERKLVANEQGYLKVKLQSGMFFVHRLVAAAFIPNPQNLPQVNHIDGDKTNNSVSNLEWCSPQQNSDHAVRAGLLNPPIGERNASAKLTEEQVRQIRAAYLPGVRQKDLAAQFGVSQRTICLVTRREGWSHVE